MMNKNWNRKFPEVPEHVHQTVLSTLAGLDERKGKRMKKGKIVILIAAAVAVFGTTVSATGIFKWNKRAAEVFVANEEQQEELVTAQIAQGSGQTVTDAGLTIQAVQTIQDNNCFYALFKITAKDESMQITAEHSMGFRLDYQEGEDPFGYLGWGFVDERQQDASNSRYFEIYGTKAESGQEDLHMKIQFTSLNAPGAKAMEGEPMIKGNWEFVLNLHTVQPVCYEINRECQIAGCAVMVRTVELTPISVKLTCDLDGVRELEKKEGVNLDQLDSITSLFINGIRYQDGTVVEEEGFQGISESWENGIYDKTAKLTTVIDVDKASALLVGESLDEITLR